MNVNTTSHTLHLLLIEDNPGDARLIAEMLRDVQGVRFQLEHAQTLKQGVEHIRSILFDAILLDLSLPDSVGIDTLNRVREAAGDTAIVVLTGFNDQTLGVLAVGLGAQDYLVKGETNANLLAKAVRYAVERQRTEVMLRRREEEYRSLITDVFNTSMVAVLILDRNYRVVWLNEATEIYFGVKRDDLIGHDKRALVDEKLKCIFADPDDYSTKLLDAYTHGTYTDRFECHVTSGEGRDERWLEHWSQPIRDGLYAGGRIEQYTDITDRIKIEAEEKRQREFAEALRDTASLLTSTLDVDEVLRRILTNIHRVVPHHLANIMILQAGKVRAVGYRDTRSADVHTMTYERFQLSDIPVFQRMVNGGEATLLDDLRDAVEQGEFPRQFVNVKPDTNGYIDETQPSFSNLRGYLGTPIYLQRDVIGLINLFSHEKGFFLPEDADRLDAFAEQAAIAIQNARLYEQSQELAAIEERTRLARELHDSVSQTLFTCSVLAESAIRKWESDRDRALDLLKQSHDLTVTALAEMRVLLLELRPATLAKVEFKKLLAQYVESFKSRGSFSINTRIDDVPSLPPDIQIGLYRIVQEAFNNIFKHAGATQVELSVSNTPYELRVNINDNGTGFEATNVKPTSLGLGIMMERAKDINAEITIDSVLDKGTHIQVIWRKIEHETEAESKNEEEV